MTEIARSKRILKKIDAGGDVEQYVWNTQTDTGAGAGLHITRIPDADFIADPENGGMNVLMQSDAQVFRQGLTPRAIYGIDETILTTPDGAEAFKVSTVSGATSTSTVVIYVGEDIEARQTKGLVLTRAQMSAGDAFTVTIYTGTTASELDFVDGTSSTQSVTVSGSTTTVWYDSTNERVYVTAGTLPIVLYSVKYEKSTPTPEVSIAGKILTNGLWYAEARLEMWTNDTPTANFPARTISLNGYEGEYDAVEIYYRHSTSDTRVYFIKGEVGNSLPLSVQGQQYNRTGGRTAEVNANNVVFSAAYYNANSNNTYAIPTKIVGIKYI